MKASETKTKEISIIEHYSMVKAILNNRKTMLRRVVNPQPTKCQLVAIDAMSPSGYSYIANAYEDYYLKAKYKPEDVLLVKESWNHATILNSSTLEKVGPQFIYLADYKKIIPGHDKFKSPVLMPKTACRIRLKVIDVRVERLLDISDTDCIAEGIEPMYSLGGKTCSFKDYQPLLDFMNGLPPRDSFASCDSINEKNLWEQNPLVWVVSFERIV